jgi:hypothetical protein
MRAVGARHDPRDVAQRARSAPLSVHRWRATRLVRGEAEAIEDLAERATAKPFGEHPVSAPGEYDLT